MDAFPSEDEAEDNLFGQVTKTWTYVFLVHDAEDFAHLLSFGLPYVPDLVMTRDLQDSRIGIHHPQDEDSPGRRRLAEPGETRESPEVYEGVRECAVVTPVDYNALFTAGETGTYGGISNYSTFCHMCIFINCSLFPISLLALLSIHGKTLDLCCQTATAPSTAQSPPPMTW